MSKGIKVDVQPLSLIGDLRKKHLTGCLTSVLLPEHLSARFFFKEKLETDESHVWGEIGTAWWDSVGAPSQKSKHYIVLNYCHRVWYFTHCHPTSECHPQVTFYRSLCLHRVARLLLNGVLVEGPWLACSPAVSSFTHGPQGC
ncbi:hypothetical protein TNCV_18251 [Trichonephila clavipes]|nr:hypothetical protein TNCV_18251 [Trichonephila clavipes]